MTAAPRLARLGRRVLVAAALLAFGPGMVAGTTRAGAAQQQAPTIAFEPLGDRLVRVRVTAATEAGEQVAAGLLVRTEGASVVPEGAEAPPEAECGFIPKPDGEAEQGYDCEGTATGETFELSAVMEVPAGVSAVDVLAFSETPSAGLQRATSTYTVVAEEPDPAPPPPGDDAPAGGLEDAGAATAETDDGDGGFPMWAALGLVAGGVGLAAVGVKIAGGRAAPAPPAGEPASAPPATAATGATDPAATAPAAVTTTTGGIDVDAALKKPTSIMDEVDQKLVIT